MDGAQELYGEVLNELCKGLVLDLWLDIWSFFFGVLLHSLASHTEPGAWHCEDGYELHFGMKHDTHIYIAYLYYGLRHISLAPCS